MSGTQSESSLSQHDAVNLLLDTQAPEEASEEVQEPTAETEVEATETEETEVEAVEQDQVETEVEEVEDDSEEVETIDTYAVKVDGEEGEATIDELIKSYQLEKPLRKDYKKLLNSVRLLMQRKRLLRKLVSNTSKPLRLYLSNYNRLPSLRMILTGIICMRMTH